MLHQIVVQCENSSDWMLHQIVVQCENNGDPMTLKIVQCELGISLFGQKLPCWYSYVVFFFLQFTET